MTADHRGETQSETASRVEQERLTLLRQARAASRRKRLWASLPDSKIAVPHRF